MSVRGQAFFDESGKPLRFIGTAVDISDIKNAEEALKRSARELARSNEDLARFAHIASHDLQEPLRMVTLYMSLLERQCGGKLDEQARESIKISVDGVNRMKELIDDLLEYSRVERAPQEFSEVESGGILEKVVADLKITIEESKAEVIWNSLPTLPCDPVQLRQLFQNLIVNAIKYRWPDVGPKIQISSERTGGEWQFSVRDNGIGIDMQFAEQIFQPFRRLHGKEFSGTGIGLATCKRIVERHGGRIWVESAPEKGSTFFFTLPATLQGGHDE